MYEYKNQNPIVSDEIRFRIHFQESGRLLLLLKNEINTYVVGYLLQEKVFELWEKVHLSSRRFEKIYANSSHVFNKNLYREMDEFENFDKETIVKLSKTWFLLSNQTISFFYSTIERNPKHNLYKLDDFYVEDKENTLGKLFNNPFISILSALLNVRWKAERNNVKNSIYINGKSLDKFKIEDKYKDVPISFNKHLIRTIIAQCLNNSLYSNTEGGGHRYDNEIKRVDITLTDSKITIKDSSLNNHLMDQSLIKDLEEKKADDARSFLIKKKYIKNMMCEEYSCTTLTTLQGVVNYFRISCDFGYKDNNFEVSITFNKKNGNKNFDY